MQREGLSPAAHGTVIYEGSQPKHPCRASKSNVRLLAELRIEALERACAAGETYYYVLVSDCSQRAARRASPISPKVRRRRRFKTMTPRSTSTKKPPRPILTTPATRSS